MKTRVDVVTVAIRKKESGKEKILVVRDREKEFWTLPGGKVENKEETNLEALKRELNEEIPGIKHGKLKYLKKLSGVTPHSERNIIVEAYVTNYLRGSIEPCNEITGSKWISWKQIPNCEIKCENCQEDCELKLTKPTKNIIEFVSRSKTLNF